MRGFLVTGMFGTWVLGSLYVEHVLGYGAWDTGLAFLPMTLTVGALSLGTTARVMARLGAGAHRARWAWRSSSSRCCC